MGRTNDLLESFFKSYNDAAFLCYMKAVISLSARTVKFVFVRNEIWVVGEDGETKIACYADRKF